MLPIGMRPVWWSHFREVQTNRVLRVFPHTPPEFSAYS